MKPDPHGTAATTHLLTFNHYWDHRYTHAAPHLTPWAPNHTLTPATRAHYNTHLPIHTYLDHLQAILGLVLPAPSWLPLPLRQRTIPSIPDLWADLPAHYHHRLTWQPHELLPLACAIASPPHFGTQPDRYPEQPHLIATHTHLPHHPHILDIGCGTGQDTWHLATHLHTPHLTGITLEPLEAWMATHRHQPHLQTTNTTQPYPAPPPGAYPPTFYAADIHTLATAHPVHLIICNGLLGGPALHDPATLQPIITRLHTTLAPGGYLLHANHFHHGHQKHQAQLHHLLTTHFTPITHHLTSHLYQAKP